jgi:hypothetical protein
VIRFPFLFFLPRALALLGLALTLHTAHATVTVSGVRFEEQIVLQGATLQLNGAGVRYKTIVRVYAAGLYVGQKGSNPDTLLAEPGPKRITITMLRDIDANELGKLFIRGVEENTPKSEMASLIQGLLRMGQLFAEQKQLKSGDTFSIDWLPGTGTVITLRGVAQPDPIKEQAFFNALLRIWLGPNPADNRLKSALLGQG